MSIKSSNGHNKAIEVHTTGGLTTFKNNKLSPVEIKVNQVSKKIITGTTPKNESVLTQTRVTQSIPSAQQMRIDLREEYMGKARKWRTLIANRVFNFLDPQLKNSQAVLEVLCGLLKGLNLAENDQLKQVESLIKELENLKKEYIKRINTDSPVALSDNKVLNVRIKIVNTLSFLLEKSDSLALDMNKLGLALFECLVPENAQVLLDRLPLFYSSIQEGSDKGGRFGRQCLGILEIQKKLRCYDQGKESLSKEKQSLFASGYVPRRVEGFLYEKHEWQITEKQMLEDGTPIPKKGICTIGLAIPGVSAREIYVPLDLSSLPLNSIADIEDVIQLIYSSIDTPKTNLCKFYKDCKGQFHPGFVTMMKFLRKLEERKLKERKFKEKEKIETKKSDRDLVTNQRESKDLKDLSKELEVLSKELEVLSKMLEKFEDLSNALEKFEDLESMNNLVKFEPLLKNFSPKQLDALFTKVELFATQLDLRFNRLILSVHFPGLKLPADVKDVTGELFNKKVNPLLDQTEQILGRRLIDSNSLRAFYGGLSTQNARKQYRIFLKHINEVENAPKERFSIFGRGTPLPPKNLLYQPWIQKLQKEVETLLTMMKGNEKVEAFNQVVGEVVSRKIIEQTELILGQQFKDDEKRALSLVLNKPEVLTKFLELIALIKGRKEGEKFEREPMLETQMALIDAMSKGQIDSENILILNLWMQKAIDIFRNSQNP